ncbi:GerMN domain-containing protein [Treponema sp. UBA753]|uniref:GerMN domain-containing protein n=1 Tax=Treponema sp. UBA753 TaxID=1947747 RepID=UPI0025CDFB43|nr:GerMN domain-containing protein [Treponema sp. UBA753]
MAKNGNKKNSGLLVAIFCVAIIVLIMLFFMKKDKIVGNLKKTNFFERVGVSTPEFVMNHPENSEEMEEPIEIDLTGKKSDAKKTTENPAEINKIEEENLKKSENPVENQNESNNSKKDSDENKVAQENSSNETVEIKKTEKSESKKEVLTTRKANLCFISIDSDGSVSRKIVQRSMPKTDSPLTENIKALLQGPSLEENKMNCMTLIPKGTRLIGASVKNGIATLNFNEDFEFNTYGVEGCIGQLMQIVYTATEFSTVKSVQFLIEGERKDYLGTEGQWIGSPLSRSSFN